MTYYSEHSKVWVSVDCIIFGFDESKLKVLIGKRQMDPGRGEWSLYGGFVNADESIDDAAKRTLGDLTGMKKVFMRQVGAFGTVDRDPGERVISIAYYALINVKDYSEKLRKEHGLEWVNVTELPQLYSDHNEMVRKAWKLMKQKMKSKRIKEMDFIEKTELIDKLSSKRGASLYRFNKKMYNEDSNFKL